MGPPRTSNPEQEALSTSILSVRPSSIKIKSSADQPEIENWDLEVSGDLQESEHLTDAAQQLRESDVPVAFPTETVYGLGADATRSSAVQGIYRAKQRPSDNPLIVHVHSLLQLRNLLRSAHSNDDLDPIPKIYMPLISRFWPGPLTVLLPNPSPSELAPEVTAGLGTFGARMPKNKVALALLKLTDKPLAAPSANASTKPSPTTAQHVKHDLNERITTIIDGGPCDVGVESTVVDGLSDPPLILRPGGVSLEALRSCPGWSNVAIGYRDMCEPGAKPKAPGMKYKHYSPKATVVLFEAGTRVPDAQMAMHYLGEGSGLGIIRTTSWPPAAKLMPSRSEIGHDTTKGSNGILGTSDRGSLDSNGDLETVSTQRYHANLGDKAREVTIWDIGLGSDNTRIAHGLFSALRGLDAKGVEAILVEGIDERASGVASAVMNRLRKASEIKVR